MPSDTRSQAARYYDLQPFHDDLPFYERLIPSPAAAVLELGCGTGRILVPLAGHCGYMHGLDLSPAMLEICRSRAERAGLPRDRYSIERGDASSFRLDRSFDLIIAPFRVFQALETDPEVEGCLRCIAAHLAENGSCVLSMFNPVRSWNELLRGWRREEEVPEWEATLPGGERIVCSSLCQNLEPQKQVLYPDLVYRRFQGDRVIEHFVQPISMRCWYPDEIQTLLEERGFRLVSKWGGYRGEAYGEGPELILQFALER